MSDENLSAVDFLMRAVQIRLKGRLYRLAATRRPGLSRVCGKSTPAFQPQTADGQLVRDLVP